MQARCRMLMVECGFNDQNRAQIVLDLMEEVENDENCYPLHYYVDAAHNFANLQAASEFLVKECPIQGFCAGDKIPIHEVQYTYRITSNLTDTSKIIILANVRYN